jgi:hypothetical protein
MKLAETLILDYPEKNAEIYVYLFPQKHPDIKKEDEKIKQAWLDGYKNRKQFEKKKEQWNLQTEN